MSLRVKLTSHMALLFITAYLSLATLATDQQSIPGQEKPIFQVRLQSEATESSYSFEDAYQEALKFRDHKISIYTTEQSTKVARETFYALAMFNHSKSMHNFAMIVWKEGKLPLAYTWFKKASELGIEQSGRNLARMEEKGFIYKEPNPSVNDLPPEQLAFYVACVEAKQQLTFKNDLAARFWVEQAVKKRCAESRFINILDICNYVIAVHKRKERIDNIFLAVKGKEKESIQTLVSVLSQLYPTESHIWEFSQKESEKFFNEPRKLHEHLECISFYCGVTRFDSIFPFASHKYLVDASLSKQYLERIIERLKATNCYDHNAISGEDLNSVTWHKHAIRLIESSGRSPTAEQVNEAVRLATHADSTKLIENATLQQIEYSLYLKEILSHTPTTEQVEHCVSLAVRFGYTPRREQIIESLRLATETDESRRIFDATPAQIDHSLRLTVELGHAPTVEQINEAVRLRNSGIYDATSTQIDHSLRLTKELGHVPNSDEIKDSLRLTAELGHTPTVEQVNEAVRLRKIGIYDATLIQIDHSLRLTAELGHAPTNEQITHSISLTVELGHIPTVAQIDGCLRLTNILRHPPSVEQIDELLRLATEPDATKRIDDARPIQIEHSLRLADELGHTPTVDQINEAVRLAEEPYLSKRIVRASAAQIEHSFHLRSTSFDTPTAKQIEHSLCLAAVLGCNPTMEQVNEAVHIAIESELSKIIALAQFNQERKHGFSSPGAVTLNLPSELLSYLFSFLPTSQFYNLSLVCQSWNNPSIAQYVIRCGLPLCLGKIGGLLDNKISTDQFPDAFTLFSQATSLIHEQEEAYIEAFYSYARAALRGEHIKIYCSDQQAQKAAELLCSWNSFMIRLRGHNPKELNDILRENILHQMFNESASLISKLKGVDLLSLSCYEFDRYPNPFYDPDLGKMVLKKLAEKGHPWYNMLYALRFGKFIEEPIYESVEDTNISEKFDLFVKTFLEQPQPFPHPELLPEWGSHLEELNQLASSTFVGFKLVSNEKGEYIQRAVDQLIDGDNPSQVLSFFRVFCHGGGRVQLLHTPTPLYEDLLLINCNLRKEYLKPYIDQMQEYLMGKNLYNPPFQSSDQLVIRELDALTMEHFSLISKMNEIKVRWKDKGIKSGNETYTNYYGPTMMIMSGNGSLTLCKGGLEAVEECAVISRDTIIEGVAYIKARNFKLLADFDALDGAVIIAENFDLNEGRIWNPLNCHLIKASKVKLDNSTQINE